VKEYHDTRPVEFIWTFKDIQQVRPEVLPEEVTTPDDMYEGVTKKIAVNVYERNPVARRICIDHYGYSCTICGFNFEEAYGELGKEYIHVHHMKPLSEIGEEYKIDPIGDLRPICPNCHAMIHKRNPPYSIEEVRVTLREE
jgi:predicted HNH restriction endonuclease